MPDIDHPVSRSGKSKTIDGGARTIGFMVLDFPGDGIILTTDLVDRLNLVIFNVTGMEAITPA